MSKEWMKKKYARPILIFGTTLASLFAYAVTTAIVYLLHFSAEWKRECVFTVTGFMGIIAYVSIILWELKEFSDD